MLVRPRHLRVQQATVFLLEDHRPPCQPHRSHCSRLSRKKRAPTLTSEPPLDLCHGKSSTENPGGPLEIVLWIAHHPDRRHAECTTDIHCVQYLHPHLAHCLTPSTAHPHPQLQSSRRTNRPISCARACLPPATAAHSNMTASIGNGSANGTLPGTRYISCLLVKCRL